MPEPEFLIDECLTPFLKHIARDFGFDAKSVLEVGLSGQTDVAIFADWRQRRIGIPG